MQVKLLTDRSCCCFSNKRRVAEGSVVEASPASNQPDHEAKGLLWVDGDPDCYGILLHADDYEVVKEASRG